MKKLFEKIVSVATAAVGAILALLLLLTAFTAPQENPPFGNVAVKTLLILLVLFFAILLGLEVYLAFRDPDRLKDVVLSREGGGAVKATMRVVRSTAVRAVRAVPGAIPKRVRLVSDENGNVRLKLDLKILGAEGDETALNARESLERAFEQSFSVRFYAIDLNVVSYGDVSEGQEKKEKTAKEGETKETPDAEPPIVAIEPLGENQEETESAADSEKE